MCESVECVCGGGGGREGGCTCALVLRCEGGGADAHTGLGKRHLEKENGGRKGVERGGREVRGEGERRIAVEKY